MKKFIRIGIDLGKRYFQVHALESEDGRAVTRKLRRSQFLAFFAGVEPCFIGMEACGSAHFWARELRAIGHDARLMPPIYVKPYVKRGKNDAVDAAAVCEAMSRPGMRFVPVKSIENQAALMLHKTRDLLIKQKTMGVNALRGQLAEFGIAAAKGIGHAAELIEKAQNATLLPEAAKAAVKVFARQLEALDASLAALEKEIAAIHAQSPMSKLLAGIPGVAKILATAIVATAPDPRVFKSGRDFSAWLGIVPRQDSTGGKVKLGSITKRGNRYIRKLLVLSGATAPSDCGGATSLLAVMAKRRGALRDWCAALLAKKPARLVTLALANKLARIIWAMMTTGEAFRTQMFERA